MAMQPTGCAPAEITRPSLPLSPFLNRGAQLRSE